MNQLWPDSFIFFTTPQHPQTHTQKPFTVQFLFTHKCSGWGLLSIILSHLQKEISWTRPDSGYYKCDRPNFGQEIWYNEQRKKKWTKKTNKQTKDIIILWHNGSGKVHLIHPRKWKSYAPSPSKRVSLNVLYREIYILKSKKWEQRLSLSWSKIEYLHQKSYKDWKSDRALSANSVNMEAFLFYKMMYQNITNTEMPPRIKILSNLLSILIFSSFNSLCTFEYRWQDSRTSL